MIPQGEDGIDYNTIKDLHSLKYIDKSGKECTEEWRAVVGLEGYYEVSDLGRVKSLKRNIIKNNKIFKQVKEKILSGSDNGKGYLTVMFSIEGKSFRKYIHRLVMGAFEGSSELQVDHKSRDKKDNRLANLRYCTGRENKHFYFEEVFELPIGVFKRPNEDTYISVIYIENEPYYLGRFNTPEEASDRFNKVLENWNNDKVKPYIRKSRK